MTQHKHIEINYHEDPIDPNVKTYTQDIDLGPKNDYFTDKQQKLQMTALANSLKTVLPKTAVILDVNNHDFNLMRLDQFLNMLNRNDDYLAITLFDDSNDSSSNDSSSNDSSSNDSKIMYIQKDGHRTYHKVNINQVDPDDNDKVSKIGSSKLLKPILYKDLKPLLSNDLLFNVPLGMVPERGSVTANRLKTFALNSNLPIDTLLKAHVTELGIVKDTTDAPYKLYAFTIKDEDKKSMNKADTTSKPIDEKSINEKLDEIITLVKNEPDVTNLPKEIVDHVKLTDPKQKAAYLFDLINQMNQGNYEHIESLTEPETFLKAVNALSWN